MSKNCNKDCKKPNCLPPREVKYNVSGSRVETLCINMEQSLRYNTAVGKGPLYPQALQLLHLWEGRQDRAKQSTGGGGKLTAGETLFSVLFAIYMYHPQNKFTMSTTGTFSEKVS